MSLRLKKSKLSQIIDIIFFDMAGLTFQEKTFQNMVIFYRSELINIVNTREQDTVFRKFPTSVNARHKNYAYRIKSRKYGKLCIRAAEFMFFW